MLVEDMRVMKTKQALYHALIELLANKTLETISISEICRHAKVNRGTFYLHYQQKEDLFEEYFKKLMLDLEDCYNEPYRYIRRLTPKELDPSTIRIFHHVKKHKDFYKIVFSRNSSLHYYYLFYEKIKSLMGKNTNIITDGVTDPDLLISYQGNAIVGMVMHWSEEEFSSSAEYMNQQLAHFLKNYP